MRSRGIIAALTVLVGAILGGASMANAATLSKGTIELTPSATFSRSSYSFAGADAGSITIVLGSFRLGYCMTDHFEVDGGILVDHFSLDPPGSGSANATSFGFAAGVSYNFSSSGQLIPFVRGAVGIVSNSGELADGNETSFLAPILQAGIRMMVGSSASVNFAADYRHEANSFGDPDLSANTFGLEVGVSVFPRRP